MIDHIGFPVSDYARSKAFYLKALAPLDYSIVMEITQEEHGHDPAAGFGANGKPDFWIGGEGALNKPLHVAIAAKDRATVDAFYKAAMAAGGRDNGAPGIRAHYHPNYYGAFVLDPDGNSIEAVHRDAVNPGLDHLWLRTCDVAAARRFYETVAPLVGVRLVHDAPEKVRFTDGQGSFTFVDGAEPTERVHLAFGAGDRATVDAFHAAAVSAGYTDNGAPGERPEYHPGYYGAFVLDPDGHNVEAVFHERG